MSPHITIEEQAHMVVLEEAPRSNILGALTDLVLIALVFLFPLFYLPNLRDGIELPKQLLLLALTTLAGVLWLGHVFVEKRITIRKSFLFFPVILFFVGWGIGTITSIDRYTSFFGGFAGEYASFASLVGFVLLLFFVATSDRDLILLRRLLVAFFASTAIVGIFTLTKIFGVPIPGTPLVPGWNPLGSIYALGVFEASALLLASGILLFDPGAHRAWLPARSAGLLRALAATAGLVSLVTLVIIDWWVAWTVVLLGSGLLLLFVFIYAHTFRSIVRLLLPLLTFVIAIVLLFVSTPVSVNLPIELAPGPRASIEIAEAVLREYPALGSGPSTYSLDYAAHRPSGLVATPLWNARFDRASSFVLTLLPTTGLVGAILWLLFLGMVIGFAIRNFLRERDATVWLLTIALFLPWLGTLIARALYSSTMSLEFLFWFLTALLLVVTSRKRVALNFATSPRALIGTSFGAVIFAVLMVILLLLGTTRAAAWAALARASQATLRGDLVLARTELLRAGSRDPRTDVFFRGLAETHLLLGARSTNVTELQRTLNAAVAAGQRAVAASPENAQNWSMLGAVYREMAPVVTGAGELARDAFRRAAELEPRNPAYPTELGRVEIILADRLEREEGASVRITEHLDAAIRLFEDALATKSDFAPAHFYISLVLERQGKLREATSRLGAVVLANPRDVGAIFQLGLLFLKDGRQNDAEVQLRRALDLLPNYANAHWYLASIYEARGDFDAAIREIEAVQRTNPESQLVKERLASLRAGRATRELPPPVSEGERVELGR